MYYLYFVSGEVHKIGFYDYNNLPILSYEIYPNQLAA